METSSLWPYQNLPDRCYLTSPKNLVRKGLYYNVQYYRNLGTHAFLNDEYILPLHISMLSLAPIRFSVIC